MENLKGGEQQKRKKFKLEDGKSEITKIKNRKNRRIGWKIEIGKQGNCKMHKYKIGKLEDEKIRNV